jgi:hypothetical protein
MSLPVKLQEEMILNADDFEETKRIIRKIVYVKNASPFNM